MTGPTRLYDLCHSVGDLTRWKSLEERRVNEDVLWLPESSDQVLSVRGIDGCLSSDAGVNHG